jgi:hypothetical protein
MFRRQVAEKWGRQTRHGEDGSRLGLSLWGASCCVTCICYINILHKNYTCDPQTQLNNFFTLQKISPEDGP